MTINSIAYSGCALATIDPFRFWDEAGGDVYILFWGLVTLGVTWVIYRYWKYLEESNEE
ncbi:MAG: hypothetical protein AAF558_01470 [Verrucomicrobiota bacterium]